MGQRQKMLLIFHGVRNILLSYIPPVQQYNNKNPIKLQETSTPDGWIRSLLRLNWLRTKNCDDHTGIYNILLKNTPRNKRYPFIDTIWKANLKIDGKSVISVWYFNNYTLRVFMVIIKLQLPSIYNFIFMLIEFGFQCIKMYKIMEWKQFQLFISWRFYRFP